MVLKEMKEADVKPDSVTFSYLINYCDQEEAIAEVIDFHILPRRSLSCCVVSWSMREI